MRGPSSYKLGFRNQKPGKKLEICQRLIGSLGKLPAEERERVGLPVLQGKFTEAERVLRDIVNLRGQMRALLTRRKKALAEMCHAAELSASRRALGVDYDPVQVTASGIELTREKRPVGMPGAPERLRAERGAFTASVILRWKRPVRRCVFLVEATTDPNGQTGWFRLTECTAAKCVLKDLQVGQLYWFRVAAINAHGTGPWSAVATLRPG